MPERDAGNQVDRATHLDKNTRPPQQPTDDLGRRHDHSLPDADPRKISSLQRLAGNRAVTSHLTRLNLQRNPPGVPPAPPVAPAVEQHIGNVYVLRGEIEGKAVVYTGSTARDLVARLYKDPHTWKALAQSKSTTIDFYEVKGILDIAKSGRQSRESAINEALRSAEQVAMKRERTAAITEGIGRRELNKPAAATEPNIDVFAERHSVRIGPRIRFGAGVKIGAFVGFQLLDFFLMYRDSKLAQYVMAPYLLEDESGVYALQETDRGIFRPNWYWKSYKTGPLADQRIQISKDEFNRLAEVAEILWGTTDWKGDFVPGILRQELPVIENPPAPLDGPTA